MAVVSQSIAPIAVVNLFSGIPRGTNNIYPRARVVFANQTAITLKAAGNTNTIDFSFNLPANYAYRLDTVKIAFNSGVSTEVGQFDDLANAFISLDAGTTLLARMQLESKGLTSESNVAGGFKEWILLDPFTEVFQATGVALARFGVAIFDDHADETVAQGNQTYVSFLQYDINQIFDVSINAPQPVSVV